MSRRYGPTEVRVWRIEEDVAVTTEIKAVSYEEALIFHSTKLQDMANMVESNNSEAEAFESVSVTIYDEGAELVILDADTCPVMTDCPLDRIHTIDDHELDAVCVQFPDNCHAPMPHGHMLIAGPAQSDD